LRNSCREIHTPGVFIYNYNYCPVGDSDKSQTPPPFQKTSLALKWRQAYTVSSRKSIIFFQSFIELLPPSSPKKIEIRKTYFHSGMLDELNRNLKGVLKMLLEKGDSLSM
jgi:hypothetical protein